MGLDTERSAATLVKQSGRIAAGSGSTIRCYSRSGERTAARL